MNKAHMPLAGWEYVFAENRTLKGRKDILDKINMPTSRYMKNGEMKVYGKNNISTGKEIF